MNIYEIDDDGTPVLVATHPDPEPDPNTTPPETESALLERAEQSRRDAYDAVMASGTRSMARLEDANRAGSDAFLAVLRREA